MGIFGHICHHCRNFKIQPENLECFTHGIFRFEKTFGSGLGQDCCIWFGQSFIPGCSLKDFEVKYPEKIRICGGSKLFFKLLITHLNYELIA